MGIKDRELLVPKSWRAHVNPWVRDSEIADLLILRGAILWSYAHIEQVITEISIHATYQTPYRGLREKPPFSMAQRLAHLRTVLNEDGPLSKYRRYGLAMIARYEASREIRNQMAHSDMYVTSVSGREFREIIIADGEIVSRRMHYWPGQLERVAEGAARFSHRCQRVLVALGEQRLLPTLEDGRALMLEEQGEVPGDQPAIAPAGSISPASFEL